MKLKLLGANIQDAFLTAPWTEKLLIRVGPEFDYDQGKVFIISNALYELKSSSSSFMNYIEDEMIFKSNYADGHV